MLTEFTPLMSAFGGALVGLSAVLLMALHGRILGATGVVGGLLRFNDGADWALRAALLLGMLAAPTALVLMTGEGPQIQIPVSTPAILLGGMIVGFGTFFGGGCTSGHGVCGNARFSRRSITATISFMIGTFITVFIIRHLIGA